MPPPVEPVLQTMQLRNSIQIGREHRPLSKSCETKPVVVAIEMTLNAACRSDVRKLGYVPCHVRSSRDAEHAHDEHQHDGLRFRVLQVGRSVSRRSATKWRAKFSEASTISTISTSSIGQ